MTSDPVMERRRVRSEACGTCADYGFVIHRLDGTRYPYPCPRECSAARDTTALDGFRTFREHGDALRVALIE